LLFPTPTSHGAEEPAHRGTDRCTFSSISCDGAPDRSQSRTTSPSPKQSALRGAGNRWRCTWHSRIRRIKSALLSRPAVTLSLIALLLLRTLPSAWIDIDLASAAAGKSSPGFTAITAFLIECSPAKACTAEAAPKHPAAPRECPRSNGQSNAENQDSDTGGGSAVR
jgi:hypothetical protein